MHLLNILRVRGVYQNTNCRHDIARGYVFLIQLKGAAAVLNSVSILIFVDHLERHETFAESGRVMVTGPASRSNTAA
jgi:hypothetical protein